MQWLIWAMIALVVCAVVVFLVAFFGGTHLERDSTGGFEDRLHR